MAKIEFTGLEAYERMLEQLSSDIASVEKMAVYDGAKVAADGIRSTIESWSVKRKAGDGMTKKERDALLSGLGISEMQQNDGNHDVKIGFNGYDTSIKTKTHPRGVPIPLTARSLIKGTSWRVKDNFMSKAVSKIRKKTESAIESRLEDEIKKRTK